MPHGDRRPDPSPPSPESLDSASSSLSFHMTPDEFRRLGAEVVEWVARYMERVDDLPVLARVPPGWVRDHLPPAPPSRGEDWDRILGDVDEIILPGLTHWQSPRFFAFFPANVSGPSVLAELLSAGLGVQGMLWSTSPACTELETHMLDWVVDALGLPDRFRSHGPGGGVIQDSASSATLCALLAARERAQGHDSAGGTLSMYTSTEAHSSVEKAARIVGIPASRFRKIAVDDQFAMRPDALAAAVETDLAAGLRPFLVIATAGTTSALGFDPIPEIADVCQRHGLWLHVDAAMAGSAAVCEDLRFVNSGADQADSWCFNPHKWLFTNFDCDCFWVADREPLLRALRVLPEYLRDPATKAGSVTDYRDWQIPLGRRFRALKLWFVLRHYGTDGLAHHVRRHVELAHEFASWVDEDERFEIAAPVRLNLVCFRLAGAGDERNERLLREVNDTGRAYLTHSRLDGRFTLRMCVGQTWTERRHVEEAWELVTSLA